MTAVGQVGQTIEAARIPDVGLPMCAITNISCMAGQAAQSAFAAIVKAIGAAVVAMIAFLSSFWLDVPSPVVATGSGGGGSWAVAPAVATVQGYIAPFTAAVAIASFAVGIIRVLWTSNGGEARLLLRQVAMVGAGTTVVAAATQLLIQAGDAFSPWIIQRAGDGRDPSEGIKSLIGLGFVGGDPSGNLGLWFVLFLVAVVGAIVQCVFMVFRGAALVVLMAFVAPTAAGAASEEGFHRFKRLALVILGFALYKPVAAIIVAMGITLMTQTPGSPGSPDGSDGIQNAVYGLTMMVMAALALPAFIKFLLPAAAMGSSSAFSGAAVLGVAAAGAAIVATGGWGGAAAGAAGAAGAGSLGVAFGAAGGAAGGAAAGSAGATGATGVTPPPPSGSAGPGAAGGASGGGGGGGSRVGAGAGIAGAAQSAASTIGAAEPDEGAA